MRTNTIYTFLITILFIGLTSCEKDNVSTTHLPPHTLKVTDIEGIVGYWDQDGVNTFTINVTVPNTIDSRITGLVEDLPTDFRTEGIAVIFSGEYKESNNNPKPILGGQSIYSLTLSSIKIK